MRIGIAQINPTVGDLRGNFEKILTAYERLATAGAELVLAPELAITGYPPQDLVFKSRFVPQNLEALDACTNASASSRSSSVTLITTTGSASRSSTPPHCSNRGNRSAKVSRRSCRPTMSSMKIATSSRGNAVKSSPSPVAGLA